jgi:protein gp37
MGNKTAISWTNRTWNPFMGCTKVSTGCKNCYAYREQLRFGKDPTKIRISNTTFTAPLKWRDHAMVFVCSWSDFFHDRVPIEWLDAAWSIIRRTPHLTYQILTKRPEEIQDSLPADWGTGYPNVWLGVTVEDANNVWRMETLADTPAALRFASYEPALGPLPAGFVSTYSPRLRWLIAGGESGPRARLPNPAWMLDALRQCRAAGIPFHFKQWGGARKIDGAWGGDLLAGKQYHEFPRELSTSKKRLTDDKFEATIMTR